MDPDFYNDMEKSQKTMQKIKQLKDKVERYNRLVADWEDAKTLVALAIEEDDDSLFDEIKQACEDVEETLENMTLETLLSGKYDKCNAITFLFPTCLAVGWKAKNSSRDLKALFALLVWSKISRVCASVRSALALLPFFRLSGMKESLWKNSEFG